MNYNPDWSLRSNIAYILHQADMMATHIEYDQWMRLDEEENVRVSESIKKAVDTKTDDSDRLKNKSQDLFEELFGEKE